MKLIHLSTQAEVSIGDKVRSSKGEVATVEYYRQPSSAASEGNVTVKGKRIDGEFYVSVFDMRWIDREDREQFDPAHPRYYGG